MSSVNTGLQNCFEKKTMFLLTHLWVFFRKVSNPVIAVKMNYLFTRMHQLPGALQYAASYATHYSHITVLLFFQMVTFLQAEKRERKKKGTMCWRWVSKHYFRRQNNRCCFKAVGRESQMLLLVYFGNICPTDTNMKPGHFSTFD